MEEVEEQLLDLGARLVRDDAEGALDQRANDVRCALVQLQARLLQIAHYNSIKKI